jgi:hypothetical protein
MEKRSKPRRIPRPIPLNIDVVKFPRAVFHNCVADIIRSLYAESRGIKIHPKLKAFFDSQSPNLGYDWMRRFGQATIDDKPIEFLERWLEVLPSGMERAELRAYIKARKAKETNNAP